MTQDDKAKRYDEALGNARQEYNTTENVERKQWLEELFPELIESDDERIRKELISFLQLPHPQFVGERKQEKWLAWLEKQEGCECIKKDWLEHIKQSWYKEGFIDGKYTPKKWTINDTTTLNELIDFFENGTAKLQHDITKYANWLKIQFTPIEKQSEQKLANKVEPKFKMEKGKWYVCDTSRYTDFIVGKAYYCPKNGMLKPNENEIARYVARDCFHLWTIADAKDGDILAENKGDVILMFRGIGNTEWDDVIDYRCYYDCYRKDFIVQEGIEYWGDIKNNQLKPATKEQRDLLFAKMKEAGYEWDGDKKELKKIEEKYFESDRVEKAMHKAGYEWSEETHQLKKIEQKKDMNNKLTDFEYSLKHIMEEAIECGDTHNLKADADMLIRLAQKPTAWSGEDDKKQQSLIKGLEDKMGFGWASDPFSREEYIDWLKSFKQKIQPQPMQEWSKEDERIYQSIIDDTVQENQLNDKQTNWLRDIKYRYFPQPKQEWSEEDKEMIDKIIDYMQPMPIFFESTKGKSGKEYTKEFVKNATKLLKSLKYRCTWKPTDGQIKALKETCDEHWEPDGLDPLYTLYENLKKLKGE